MNTSTKVQNFTEIRKELDPNKILFCLDDNNQLVHEIFKDIPDYEGMYQISTFGRMKSLKRKHRRKDKILIQSTNRNNYLIICLSKQSKLILYQVHQLVTITFKGHKPCGFELVVDHKDNIKANNFVWNLQLITNRENVSKDRKDGTSKYPGVHWNKISKKWAVSIKLNKKPYHLGYFKNEKEAYLTYKKALQDFNNGMGINRQVRLKSSQYIGVTWVKQINKWKAYTIGNQKHLGYFKNEYDAYLATQKTA